MQVSHQVLQAAVADTHDAELASWVHAQSDYVVSLVPDARLTQFDRFRVINVAASHPLSFELVRDRITGEVLITTERPAALRSVLHKEAALLASDALFALCKDLLAVAPAATHVLTGTRADALPDAVQGEVSAPALTQGLDGLQLTLFVRDELQRVQCWSLDLPWQGEASFVRSTLARVGGAS